MVTVVLVAGVAYCAFRFVRGVGHGIAQEACRAAVDRVATPGPEEAT